MLSKQSAAHQTAPLRKTDDDYDDEEEEGDTPDIAVKKPAETNLSSKAHDSLRSSSKQLEENQDAASRKEGAEEWEKKQAAPKPKKDALRIRKNGLLLLSEMFVGPATQPKIARTRTSKTSHTMAAKVNCFFCF